MYGVILLFLDRMYGFRLPFFVGYFNWLLNVFRGNLGHSTMLGVPVAQAIAENMWVSFSVVMIGLAVAYLIAIPIGIKAGVNKNSKFDVISSTFSLVCISFPAFFFCVILIRFLAVEFGIFPIGGMISGNLPEDTTAAEVFFNRIWHFILPIMIIVILNIGALMRHTRTNMIEVMDNEYIKSGRAMGISDGRIVGIFAFKNTVVPLSTFMAGVLPTVFSGALVVEILFALPGIGFAMWRALFAGDIAFLMGFNMFIGVLTVLGNFISDIIYAIVDPRIYAA